MQTDTHTDMQMHTHTQTDANECLTPATVVSMSNNITPNNMHLCFLKSLKYLGFMTDLRCKLKSHWHLRGLSFKLLGFIGATASSVVYEVT